MLKAFIIAWTIVQASDGLTTCAGLRHGFHEANPLLPTACAGISALKAADTVAEPLIWRHTEKAHPTLTRWFAGAAVVVIGAAAAHNAVMLARH